ncbi:MAG: helix-turn-helix domain-containing protein [Rhodocyclaceae bacterium]
MTGSSASPDSSEVAHLSVPVADALAGNAGYLLSRMETHDADEQAERLRCWDQCYEQLSPGRFRGSLSEIWLGPMQLFREVTNQSVRETGSCWQGSRTFGIPLAMEGEAAYCGRPMSAEAVLTLCGGDELDFRSPRFLDIVGICVQAPVFQRLTRCLEGDEAERRLEFPRLLRVAPDRLEELRALLRSVFGVLDACPAMLDYAQVRKNIEHSLLSRLVALASEAGKEPESPVGYLVRRRVVERARGYLLAHRDEPVSVSDLCALTGVSRRTLQYCFQEVLGVKPVHYLRALRLAGVRRELKAQGSRFASVGDVAARWGFWHLSHFAADYRKMFGELPSETLSSSRPA